MFFLKLDLIFLVFIELRSYHCQRFRIQARLLFSFACQSIRLEALILIYVYVEVDDWCRSFVLVSLSYYLRVITFWHYFDCRGKHLWLKIMNYSIHSYLSISALSALEECFRILGFKLLYFSHILHHPNFALFQNNVIWQCGGCIGAILESPLCNLWFQQESSPAPPLSS